VLRILNLHQTRNFFLQIIPSGLFRPVIDYPFTFVFASAFAILKKGLKLVIQMTRTVIGLIGLLFQGSDESY
jgi:hypothetical protein